MARRFDDDPHGRVIFRSRPTAIPIVVTATERDVAIADFIRATARLGWSFIAGLVVACVLLVVLDRPEDEQALDIWVVVIIASLGFALLYWRAWHAPTRRFAGRTIAGPAPTRKEARQRALAQIRWRDLWVGAASIVIAIGSQATRQDLLHGWARLWLVAGGLGLIVIGWRMATKLRSDRVG